MKHLCILILAPLTVIGAARVVPGSEELSEGNTNSYLLFGTASRWQQVYSSTEFIGSEANGGWITGFNFRLDGSPGVPGAFADVSNVQISLSTVSIAPDSLSPVFANNIGPNLVTVFSGSFHISALQFRSPNALNIGLDFTTPFYYDPHQGNLLMDIQNFAPATALPVVLDAVNSGADSVSSVFSLSPTATTGSTTTIGLPTMFLISVPEPSTWAMLIGGATLLAVFGKRRKRA